jgi:hypothetical protein
MIVVTVLYPSGWGAEHDALVRFWVAVSAA